MIHAAASIGYLHRFGWSGCSRLDRALFLLLPPSPKERKFQCLYEQDRKDKIQRNQQMLDDLGIPGLASQLIATPSIDSDPVATISVPASHPSSRALTRSSSSSSRALMLPSSAPALGANRFAGSKRKAVSAIPEPNPLDTPGLWLDWRRLQPGGLVPQMQLEALRAAAVCLLPCGRRR